MNNIIDKKYEMIDENQIRIVAALVAISIVVYQYTGYISMLFFLVYHFFIRLYLTPLFSPLELIGTYISSLFSHEKNDQDRSEKEFATHLALSIVSVSIVLELLAYNRLASALLSLLVVWKILEVSKNICFGCKLYALIQKNGIEIVSL